ncbi:MAG: GrpE [Verrucomicrobiota bacterium]|jgi:molecular chaperone GrpE (heat shock protein)
MTNRNVPRIAKTPFYVADVMLLALAAWIVWRNPGPLAGVSLAMMVGCVVVAFVFFVLPHVLEYQASVKFSEGAQLTDAVAQIEKVEVAAEQIRLSTSLWQGVQEQSGRTAAAAKEIAGRMNEEAKAFAEFMQKANDTEKATLRLEVDKLRRAEGDWLQVLVRMLDHTFALNRAAARSGQQNVIEQLGHFQNACRDAARRIGLVPVETPLGETFDAEKHQLVEVVGEVPAGARVAETVATGFTYQGQPLRRPLVRLETTTLGAPAAPVAGQNELGFEIEAAGEVIPG